MADEGPSEEPSRSPTWGSAIAIAMNGLGDGNTWTAAAEVDGGGRRRVELFDGGGTGDRVRETSQVLAGFALAAALPNGLGDADSSPRLQLED